MPPIDIEEIISRLNALFDKIQSKIDWIVDRINSLLSHVPGYLDWVVDKFLTAWNAMLEKLNQFWDWFTDKLSYVGDPFLPWSTANDWHAVVGDRTKTAADSIDDDHELLVDDPGETGSVIGIPAVPATIAAGVVAFLLAAGGAVGSLLGTLYLAKEGFTSITRYATDWPEFATS